MNGIREAVVVLLGVVLVSACGGRDYYSEAVKGNDDGKTPAELTPEVVALSSTALSVGQTLFVAGRNFLAEGEGHTEIVFNGFFARDDGVMEDVSFSVQPMFDGALKGDTKVGGTTVEAGTQLLRWSRFGPFSVPFTAEGNRTGTFKGELKARNILTDGTVREQEEATSVTISVGPSLIVTKLEPFVGFDEQNQPVYAECGAPAIRALEKLPYVLEVEAVGFEPEFFMYEFRGVNGLDSDVVKVSHPAKGAVDRVGDPESKQPLVFNAVPEDSAFFYATIRVTATVKGSDGEFIETALPLSVHRALEFHMEGAAARPAQYYEPVPVSGCMPGTINNEVLYQESHSESRQNAVSVSVGKSWVQSHGQEVTHDWNQGIAESSSVSNTESEDWSHSEAESLEECYGVSYDHSESQTADFSSTDGQAWGWSYNEGSSNEQMNEKMAELYGEVSTSVNVEVSAEGSVPGFAKVGGKVGTEVGAMVGGKTGQVVGQTVGSSTDKGASMDSSKSTTESYGSATTDSTGESLSQSYALTSEDQVGGSTSQTKASEKSTVYNFGEALSQSDVVSVGNDETWENTWATTDEDSALMSYAGKIPVGQYGVFYRQTVRYAREAQVYSHNLCGVRELMGNLTFNEWAWSPALAIGKECKGSVMPRSALPAAECVIPPCN